MWTKYIDTPFAKWFLKCDASRNLTENIYPKSFGEAFMTAPYYKKCKHEVNGQLSWGSWSTWSSTCGHASQIKIATHCEPSFAMCKDIAVQQKTRYTSCPSQGRLIWDSWGHWSSTCGYASRIKIARCVPKSAICKDIPVQQEKKYTSCPSYAKFRYYNSKIPYTKAGGKIKFRTLDYKIGNVRQDYDGDFVLPEGYWFLHTNWATSGTGNTGMARIFKDNVEICRS